MTSVRLSFAPDYPVSFILAVTALVLFSVFFFYKRISGTVPAKHLKWLLGVRVAAMVILLMAIFRPVIRFQRSLFEKSTLLMLLDVSKSMSIRDFPNLPGRLERVKNSLLARNGLLASLQDDFLVSLYYFGGDVERCEGRKDIKGLEPKAEATDLSAAAAGATATVE